MIYETL